MVGVPEAVAALVAAAVMAAVLVLAALKAAAMAAAVSLVEAEVMAIAVEATGWARRAEGVAEELEEAGSLAGSLVVGPWAEVVMAAEATVAAADKESNQGQLSTPRRRSEAHTASAS